MMHKPIYKTVTALILTTLFVGAAFAQNYTLVERLDVAPVWSGHPVGFQLRTHKGRQFVGFYDQDRNMVLAARMLDSPNWEFKVLPTKVGWDSHNSIALDFDSEDYLHVSGNMHCVPLIYFRSEKPLDVQSLRKYDAMIGHDENRVTYPQFLSTPNGDLLYTYRSGSSGNGSQFWNRYDTETKTWSRLLDTPMFDGEGERNAYFYGPILGPDQVYHLCWVWRDTPDCKTNNNISYAKSKDLVNWTKSDGTPLELPIRLQTGEIIDPVLNGEGLINPNQGIGFDSQNRVIISYTKFDSAGNLQLMNARRENGEWKIYQTSDWDYRWFFEGNGSIQMEVTIGSVIRRDGDKLTQSYSHIKSGSGNWLLDEATLKPVDKYVSTLRYPPEWSKRELDWPNMKINRARDAGQKSSESPEDVYALVWETQPVNRDRPHPDPVPPPSPMRLLHLKKQ